MMILVAGPYRSGTGDDPEKMAKNLAMLERATLPLFRAGHLPVIGEWLALPLLRLAGSQKPGDAAYQEIVYPIAHHLLERCDAILRLPGESAGADNDVKLGRAMGLRVYTHLHQVPGLESMLPNALDKEKSPADPAKADLIRPLS
jgi:hypothetical protein